MTSHEFFDANGYWQTTFVPRKVPAKQHAAEANYHPRTASVGAEGEFGPFYARPFKNRFHRASCEYMRRFVKWADTIKFNSHAEAVNARRKPCQTCMA
jgi:hypothetical protein